MVIANPFAALDHEGVPAGALPFDPEHGNGARRWVGASIDMERTKKIESKPHDVLRRGNKILFEPTARHRTFYKFDLRPQVVLDTVHYRRALEHGDIFPADVETARKVGFKAFVPPAEALAKAREKAIDEWRSCYGQEPDFELWPEELLSLAARKTTPITAATTQKGNAS